MTNAWLEPPNSEVRIVKAVLEDLPSIVAVEKECGLNSRGIESHQKRMPEPNAILIVAVAGNASRSQLEILGLFSGEMVVDELQIDNLAVKETYRRKGIGRMLLRQALSNACRLGASTATLEVAAANATARSLYEKEGFDVIGVRKGYYIDPPGDALLLARKIDDRALNLS
ncbi:MAG: GNAT family N-acetyltransferase [Gammaproteobacteria bacterium]|nr:GNAT family N-acetyltransferase [Gammaproteobacteria bacterium]